MEEFCQNCDVSSNEIDGEYIFLVWYCEKCVKEKLKPQHVSVEHASNEFRKIREGLE